MRYRILIKGQVQGVGFRPFVYKIAKETGVRGFVLNSASGVVIEIEGDKDKFLEKLNFSLPPLANIESLEIEELEEVGFKDFVIKKSLLDNKSTSILPDIAVCSECLKEMFDKENRRYLYPFISCTNCGPRYSLIKDIPYDRKNTSMDKFDMCDKCKKEYTNPQDRRYHAEIISCFDCGPKLRVLNKEFMRDIEKIEYIANKIKDGEIVAIKGIGGFHLVCDATNKYSIKRLRELKNRPKKPFALMFKDLETIKEYAYFNEKEKKSLTSFKKPIVLLKKLKELEFVADDIDRYGVFLPYTPIYYLLFEFLDIPLVVTSANVSGEPIIKDSKKILNFTPFVLDYDRDIVNRVDDSLVSVVEGKEVVLRASRGYAPYSFFVKSKKKILGVGANQKSTISLALGERVIISPYIADLDSVENVDYFNEVIDRFRGFYDFDEDVIICDKHSLYESTKWALNQKKEIIQIQHHYAHALSVMFEHNLDGEFLAFLFDGTGYGEDGNIWGGEVFIVNRNRFERIKHIEYFPLIGGEKGIKNPSNMAVALIDEEFAKNYPNYKLAKSLKNGPFPLTSSMGRIFDMVAFLSGMIDKNEYEGYSGLRIERFYNENIKDYIDVSDFDFKKILNFAAKNRGDFELVSSVFLNSIVRAIESISKDIDLPIILGGGVFQNKTLLSLILNSKIKNRIFFNEKLPINDSSISLGQVAWGIWNL